MHTRIFGALPEIMGHKVSERAAFRHVRFCTGKCKWMIILKSLESLIGGYLTAELALPAETLY
jgi:hypothetical protein